MNAQKHLFFLYWFRCLAVLLLVVLLMPGRSAFAQPSSQADDPSMFARLKPAAEFTYPESLNVQGITTSGANILLDPSFENSLFNTTYWNQWSAYLGSPVCITEYGGDTYCGNGSGTAGPRTGSIWVWLGGVPNVEEMSYVSQSVPIPSCGTNPSATLQFYLWIGYAQSGSSTDDYFMAMIDNNMVFKADATQKSLYSSYKLVSVDVSAFADGGVHEVKFYGHTNGQIVNFNLDDVSLITNSTHCNISGTTSVAGAALSYTDGSSKTVYTGPSGSYTLPVSYRWSGYVTPSHPCYAFSPIDRYYSNVGSDLSLENYYPTFLTDAGCIPIDIYVGGALSGKYWLPAQKSTRPHFAGLNKGPVRVTHPSVNVLASQRVLYGNSYSEMMGLPAGQLTKEYLFPYYNNVAMDSQLRVSNLGGVPTTITVYLGTTQIDSYTLAANGATRKNYPNRNSGPLRVTSSATNILTTIRVLYGGVSYSELMGFPASQLAKEYLFPYYNNVAMDSQLRVSNMENLPTTITVYLGTTQIDSYTLAANGATRKNYPNRNSGPLRVTSSATDILTTIRVLYGGVSYSELMGFQASQLGQEYWYPVYDNTNLDSQLRVSNVGSDTTHITVYAGGVQIDSYDLGKGAATRKNYTANSGPLQVVSSTQPILTTIRMLYGSSLYEMTGLPDGQLSTEYFFPWYNNSAMNSELRAAKP